MCKEITGKKSFEVTFTFVYCKFAKESGKDKI